MGISLAELWALLYGLLPAVAAGGGVGFLSGMFGVGGGFLLVPVLNIVLGVEMEIAVGTGACQVLGPATTSLLARRPKLHCCRLPLIVAGGLFVGVYCGALVLESAKQAGSVLVQGRSIPLVDLVVLVVYFATLISVGLFALWEARRQGAGDAISRGWLAGWRLPPFAEFEEFDLPRVSITALSWFGLCVGFLSGLLGMSGGLVLVPGLIYLLGMKTQQAVLSSLVIVWIVAFQATIVHAWLENVNLPLAMALLLGGTIGARLGSEIGVRLQGRQLRERFGWLLLATGVLIGFRLMLLLLP